MTHYEILGVGPKTTSEEIKKAYRTLVRKYHPDRNPGDDTATEKFKTVQSAYDVLSDLNSRARYDLTIPKIAPPLPKIAPPLPKMNAKAQKDAEAYAALRAEIARGFTVGDAPPPKLDLWGQPINNARKKDPDFVDAFANSYSYSSDVPDIR